MSDHFTIKDQSLLWYEEILESHLAEAEQKVDELLADTTVDDNGCKVTDTKGPRRVRFNGKSDRAYRFVLAVRSNYAPSTDELVRHRCHNRLCVNPEHLLFGSRLDNWLDEVDRKANGPGSHLL
ncbi:hypothetical protein FHS72_002852 [Loktanella ponticola]|uniref:HNH nuclease domain-containing protein n=1 Tax=Yoonia ponticola TaxID=1524255 RepID=A0A7W9BMK0_9RHOB|nr:HNH endonuclease [Yoonia ponticola]MBB5723215.1 hypothetical protein [Yoonia ponticola]